jgi:sialate O-acetylesterase
MTKTFYGKFFALASFFLIFNAIANAKVIPAACFTDNMVLQQKTNAAVWGTETPGKTFTITTSWNNKIYEVTTTANGDWKIKVATPSYGGPYTITFDDGEKTVLNNVLIGEVWVASGQSNMEMPLTGWNNDVINLQQELADAANYPQIRMIKIDNKTSFTARTNVPVIWGWNVCSPQTVGAYSAAAYFFAKNLYQQYHIPIGIINSTWGGTVAEAWTSGSALKTMPAFAPFVLAAENGMTQDKINAQYQTDLREWLNTVNKSDPSYHGSLTWAMPNFDDSAWPKMNVPAYWEQSGVPNYDGTMWFRKKVNIPADWAGKDLKLDIGAIDDFDDSFFNGTEIGHSEAFYIKRSYTIPANLVKAGDNTIAIRVLDNGGLGGINKGPMILSVANDTSAKIDISGAWAYQKGNELKALPQAPVLSNSPNRPTLIYNAMISPILPFTIKGVIWYQGESNADRPKQYEQLFPLMITDWRQKWGEGNFPFYFVQIANYAATDQPPAANWPALRNAQLKTLSVPNTGMAVTIDIGENNDIHPHNKQEVGRRLALIARAKTYGEKIVYSGPVFKSQKIDGNKIELNFTNGALTAKGDTLKGFTIAGADKQFHPANAVIQGNTVTVTSTDVATPVAVRYAWANNPVCNLYNSAGLPASPFKTDDWDDVR